MLAVQEGFVNDAPKEGSCGHFLRDCRDVAMRILLLAVGALAIANIVLAYNDARRERLRAASLERELERAEAHNDRLQVRIAGLSGDPAIMERWLRERERLLPNEEIVR